MQFHRRLPRFEYIALTRENSRGAQPPRNHLTENIATIAAGFQNDSQRSTGRRVTQLGIDRRILVKVL